MKLRFLSVLGAGFLLLAVACHNDNNSPTQPVLVTPSSPTPPGSPTPTPPPPSGATRVVNVGPGNVFTDSQSGSSTTTIKAGDTVQWNFMDSVAHTTTSGNCCTANGLWDSGIKSSGSFTHKFSTAGTFPYFCTVHGTMMTGTVTVNP
jgi:plastocyanin